MSTIKQLIVGVVVRRKWSYVFGGGGVYVKRWVGVRDRLGWGVLMHGCGELFCLT